MEAWKKTKKNCVTHIYFVVREKKYDDDDFIFE